MRILILVDGSGWSYKAAVHALRIAAEKNAEVTFFAVLDRSEAKSLAFNLCAQSGKCSLLSQREAEIWRDMRRGMLDELQNLITIFTTEGVSCTMKLSEGKVSDEVSREAETGMYDLIVMGGYGRMGRTHRGSLSSRIGGFVTQPVLIVK